MENISDGYLRKFVAMKDELKEKTGEIEAKDALIRQITVENQSLRSQSEHLRKINAEVVNENQEYRRKVKVLIDNFEEAKRKHDDIISDYEKRVEAFQTETLERITSEKDSQIKHLRDELKLKSEAFTNLMEQYESLNARYYYELQRRDQQISIDFNMATKLKNDIVSLQYMLNTFQNKSRASDQQIRIQSLKLMENEAMIKSLVSQNINIQATLRKVALENVSLLEASPSKVKSKPATKPLPSDEFQSREKPTESYCTKDLVGLRTAAKSSNSEPSE